MSYGFGTSFLGNLMYFCGIVNSALRTKNNAGISEDTEATTNAIPIFFRRGDDDIMKDKNPRVMLRPLNNRALPSCPERF
jgi:hypothetical protein